MVAHVALVSGLRLRIYVEGIVGTGVHTGLAANAVVVLEVHDPIVSAVEGGRGADRHARSILTLVATHHRELAGNVGESTGLDVLHPGAVDSERDVMLALAGNGASVTANTRIAVEEKSESRHALPLSMRFQ